MKTVDLSDFCPYISPLAEGCPDVLVRRCVMDTVVDICQKTGCIRTTGQVKTKKGESEYEVLLPAGLKAEVMLVVTAGLDVLPSVRIDELIRTGRFNDVESRPLSYTFMRPDRIKFFPVPDDEYEVMFVATASVDRTGDKVPEEFFTNYLDAVTFGALSRIYRTAGQVYTNVRLAEEYALRYAAQIGSIKSDVSRDFTRSSGRVFYNRIT